MIIKVMMVLAVKRRMINMAITTLLLLLMMDGYHGKADVAELQEEIDAMGRGRKGCSAENASLTLGKDPMMVVLLEIMVLMAYRCWPVGE